MVVAFIVVAVLAFTAVFIAWLFYGTRWGCGVVGEHRVKKVLGKTVESDHYVFNNVIFLDDQGHSHQIDHLYISKAGIFVIETKLWQGKIYGNDNMDEWVQWVKKDTDKLGRKTKTRRYKNKLHNPVKQNKGHIYALKGLLGDQKYYNVVCFAKRSHPEGVSSDFVYSLVELKQLIKASNADKLTDTEMQEIAFTLTRVKEGQSSNREHVKNIKQIAKQVDEGICPRCGSKLVLKHSKDGRSFYGCSSYPKCKFTKKVE